MENPHNQLILSAFSLTNQIHKWYQNRSVMKEYDDSNTPPPPPLSPHLVEWSPPLQPPNYRQLL